MDEQYHFDFRDWKEAFEMFYRQRLGYKVEHNGRTLGQIPGNPKIRLVISTASNSSGYWVEENAKADKETKVYRSVKAVKELEKEIKEKHNRLKLDGRRVIPRPSFQPPETCPECIAGIPFDEKHKHVRSA